jgi:hypothetical protein
MDGRWVIADASDMSKSSDFLHILSKADELSAPSPKTCGGSQAYSFDRRCVRRYTSCCCALRRFALVLSQTWSRQASAYRGLQPEFAIIGRIYASECASLPGLLKSVEDQLDTAGITQRQDCARGLLLEGFLVRRSSLYLRPSRCRWPRIRSTTRSCGRSARHASQRSLGSIPAASLSVASLVTYRSRRWSRASRDPEVASSFQNVPRPKRPRCRARVATPPPAPGSCPGGSQAIG